MTDHMRCRIGKITIKATGQEIRSLPTVNRSLYDAYVMEQFKLVRDPRCVGLVYAVLKDDGSVVFDYVGENRSILGALEITKSGIFEDMLPRGFYE